MAQNIYDDAAFFEGYSQFPRSREGLAGAPEWPSLRSMLPELRDRTVLDLGCGFGAFCRWAVEQGASEVVGLDLSQRMLDTARERSGDMPIRYEQADLETFEPPVGTFDLVFSSLTVHYLADFDAFCAKVRRTLKPGGHFVFSMEHPIFASRAEPDWISDAAGKRAWAIQDYNREGERVTDWIAKGVIKHHRKIATVFASLSAHGLVLDAMDEWGPTPADLVAIPALADEIVRPMLLLMAAHAAGDRVIPA